MAYKNNIPQSTDFLSDSQLDLLNNFQQLDVSFGIDHYTYSNLTVDNGKHNKVTTPLILGGVHPTTLAAEPKFYAMQDSVELGVLQYSRGPSDAVPSPVTYFQSPNTPISLLADTTEDVLDFANITNAMFSVYVSNIQAGQLRNSVYYVQYSTTNGFNISSVFQPAQANPFLTSSGTVLQIKALPLTAATKAFYTVVFYRIWV